MSSKLTLVSVMVLAAFLAGCNTTKTSSIDPGGNGGNNGGQNGGGGNGDGGNGDGGNGDGGNGDGGNGDGGNGDGGNGGGNGDGGNGDGGDAQATRHSFTRGYAAERNATGVATSDGAFEVEVSADGSTAEVLPAAARPGSGPLALAGGANEFESADKFLDIVEGTHYRIGTYAIYAPGNDEQVRSGIVAVGGNETSQVSAGGLYNGDANFAVIQHSSGEAADVTGTAIIHLQYDPAGSTVFGEIGDLILDTDQGGMQLGGSIRLQQTDYGNTGEYKGAAVLQNVTGIGAGTPGEYKGAFYGSNAEETAGTFKVDGTLDGQLGVTGQATVIGAFGAPKVAGN